MLHHIATSHTGKRPDARASDYDVVRRALEFLSCNWREQPELDRLAEHVGLSPAHCQKVFTRWCGLSPKEFVQALTIDHARKLLRDSASVLDSAYAAGLSGSSRLHDLFVDHEAMSPGEFKSGGEGLEIAYGFHPTPFGEALLLSTSRGIIGLAFVNDEASQTREETLAEFQQRWPAARYLEASKQTAEHARRVFNPAEWRAERPVRLVLIGTDFQVRVWEALLRVPMGCAVSYSGIAQRLGAPRASRAVGSAVGCNPISFVVPCHRVLRNNGGLGGYHWGVTRKRALIGWEAAQLRRGQ
jgi:AraC family transcriptional regulator of adaptative response/methylated-DNA-[protein]-cysteine methyltransferase